MVSVGVAYDILRWEEKALIEALRSVGADVVPLHLSAKSFLLSDGLALPDVVLARSVSHSVAVESAAVLEGLGVRVINSSHTIAIATDKVRTASILRRYGLPTPLTGVAFSPESALRLAREMGFPVVVKPVNGSWGRMVALARDEEELRGIVEHRRYLPGVNSRVYLIQEFIRKPGRDIRVFVVGDRIPVAIYRFSDHWITNTARGGRASRAKVDEELSDLVLRAAEAVKGEVLGIDIFEDRERGYLINEVNAVTEFKNTVRVTGVRLQNIVAEYAVSVARR